MRGGGRTFISGLIRIYPIGTVAVLHTCFLLVLRPFQLWALLEAVPGGAAFLTLISRTAGSCYSLITFSISPTTGQAFPCPTAY